MNGFAIRQQDHSEEAVVHLRNLDPASIGARPDGREIGRDLHRFTLSELTAASKTLNEQSTTIVQVTHSETNAASGNRIITPRDGFMETS